MSNASMRSHTVWLDQDDVHAPMRFADVFNAAVAFIDRHVEEGRGEKLALLAGDRKITYAQLAENAARCGNVLKDLGLSRGDRVLMASVDTPEFFYVFWGAVKAGLVAVPVNTQLKDPEYRVLIEDSGCAAIYVDCSQEPVAAARACGMDVSRVLSKDGVLARMREASPELAPAETSGNDDCFWLYSSGSTGRPKGAVHVHKDMAVTSTRYGANTMGVRSDDVVFCASKLFFSYGFGGGMTFPLWVGATIVLCDELPSAEMAFRMIETYRPTVYFGMPTLYRNQLQLAETRSVDMSSIRLVPSAGEQLPEAVFHKWKERFGVPILDGIGSSEVLHVFISNRPDDIRPGTSGRPVVGYEVKIVGENGQTLGPNEIGVLMVKGQSLARCYWNNPEKTASTMLGEWLNTGDMYYYDEDNYYVSVGRADDMIKVGGMWCSPNEIENALISHPKVAEAAVIGQKDDDGLLKPAAFIVLHDRNDANDAIKEELKQFCKEKLARYKYPRWFTFMDQLPKTGTGKLQRFRLHSMPRDAQASGYVAQGAAVRADALRVDAV